MKTILVVDDELFARRIISYKLKSHGYTVLTADCAETALQLVQSQALDLVLTDLQMPGMSGIELAEVLMRDSRQADVPVLLITAREFEVDRNRCRQTNIKEVIAKPFSMTSIIKRVSALIGPGELVAAAASLDD